MKMFKPKPWVKKWHVAVLYWALFFPHVFFGHIKSAFKWAAADTKEEISRFDF